jgi:hypothetical protein
VKVPRRKGKRAGDDLRLIARELREGARMNELAAELLEKAADGFERTGGQRRGDAVARALGLMPAARRPLKAERDLNLYYFVQQRRWARTRSEFKRGDAIDISTIVAVPACEADYKKAGVEFGIDRKTAKNIYLALAKKLAQ